VAKAGPGIRFNEHIEGDGPTALRPCLQLGLEGIASMQLGSPYRSGRSQDWVKSENPKPPAIESRSRGRLGQKEMAIIA
jgi:ATP-dependent DNA ligase